MSTHVRLVAAVCTIVAASVALSAEPVDSVTVGDTLRSSVAGALLSSPQYHWALEENSAVRLYSARDSPGFRHRAALARASAVALARNVSLLHEKWPDARVSIFCFSTSAEVQRAIGRDTKGFVQPGEDTIVLVDDGRRPPVLLHEMMHIVMNHLWGVQPSGKDWLSEGIATWSLGRCQGYTFRELTAGIRSRRELPPLRTVAQRFRKFDELKAFVIAASVVEFIVERYGVARLRAVWNEPGTGHPLGVEGIQMEREWQESLRGTAPRFLNTARVESTGCEDAIP